MTDYNKVKKRLREALAIITEAENDAGNRDLLNTRAKACINEALKNL